MKERSRKRKCIAGLFGLLIVTSCGVFSWAVAKTDSIATTAENTGGSGAGDQILWLWLLLSVVGFYGSVIGLGMTFSRRPSRLSDR
jgi:amino acid transporter